MWRRDPRWLAVGAVGSRGASWGRDDLASRTGNEGWVPHGPDFLWRLVALIHSMRLSLLKGAHADLSSTAWQEIGSSPVLA